MKNPQEVFNSHKKAVETLNPLTVLEDYSDDAVFITPDHTYKGKEEILSFYKNLLPNFDGFEFKTIKRETHNDLVFFVWRGHNKFINVEIATDTYIIKNGKITQHTFAGIIN
ncbi:MAG: nuclear transport factor 2 family protein [Tenacibaculum sp.]|nr:nuclear transport factor 2 family protein [Tenacibaculum sp.]